MANNHTIAEYLTFFLFQFSQRFLYAAHSLADVIVAGGVAHTEAIGVAEGVAAYCCHVTLFEEEHGEVGGVADGLAIVALAVEARALGEEVERTLRTVHFQTGYLLGEAHDEVAAALEGFAHGLNALLRGGVCCLGCLLAY